MSKEVLRTDCGIRPIGLTARIEPSHIAHHNFGPPSQPGSTILTIGSVSVCRNVSEFNSGPAHQHATINPGYDPNTGCLFIFYLKGSIMKSRVLASLFAAAAIFAGSYASSYAQCPDVLCLPNGTPVTCTVDPSGTKVWIDAAGNTYPGGTGGTGDFVVTQCACGNTDIQLVPTGLNITSSAGPLGIIHTTLNPTAPQPVAHFHSLQLPNTFPAFEEFAFNVQATASAFPGKIFRATTQLRFRSDNVHSFNPHQQEPFYLVQPVDFVDPVTGNLAFRLVNVTIRLN